MQLKSKGSKILFETARKWAQTLDYKKVIKFDPKVPDEKKLKDLKSFLIYLFSNPKMREAVPGSASISSDPSVFHWTAHGE